MKGRKRTSEETNLGNKKAKVSDECSMSSSTTSFDSNLGNKKAKVSDECSMSSSTLSSDSRFDLGPKFLADPFSTLASSTFQAIAFPEQVIIKKGDFVRSPAGTPVQFHTVGIIRHVHLDDQGTLGCFDIHNIRDARRQLTLEGPEVQAFHERVGQIVTGYKVSGDMVTIKRPVEETSKSFPFKMVDKDRNPINSERFVRGSTVIVTCFLKHYSFMQKNVRTEGFTHHLLGVRLLEDPTPESECSVEIDFGP